MIDKSRILLSSCVDAAPPKASVAFRPKISLRTLSCQLWYGLVRTTTETQGGHPPLQSETAGGTRGQVDDGQMAVQRQISVQSNCELRHAVVWSMSKTICPYRNHADKFLSRRHRADISRIRHLPETCRKHRRLIGWHKMKRAVRF